MLAEERKKIICEIVNKKKAVRVSELSKRLNITEATVRRDLDELQSEKRLRRTHGGAVALYPAGLPYVISELAVENIDAKRKIAQAAYEHIDDYDTILVDGSSTVLEFSKILAAGDKRGIIVLTNSLSVVNALSMKKDVTVINVGGEVRYNINSTVGEMAENTIRNLRVDKTFLGVNGIDLEYGFSITNFDEAALKKEMIKSAKQSFVLADHSKFGATYLAKIAEIAGDIDFLVTDEKIEDFDYVALEEHVYLITAEE